MSDVEIEYCTHCRDKTQQRVQYKTMSNGLPMRKGTCINCGWDRALPFNDKKPEDLVLYFGKYKGKKLSEVPSDYLKWCLENVDLNTATRHRFQEVIDRK